MHGAVTRLAMPSALVEEAASKAEFTPAVTVRKSLSSKDHIISLIDGKPYKTLKRHLSRHGLTPDQYRERYGLKSDYPMVSENYAEMRRSLAKKIGLGRKAGTKVAAAKSAVKPATVKSAAKAVAKPKAPRRVKAPASEAAPQS
jgi:predicted transcriptional regulator